jgi:hypothetical protein
MALCGAAAVPEQLECGVERAPAPVPPAGAGLAGQPLSRGLVQPLSLQLMGQLSEYFVVQHFLPSFPCVVVETRNLECETPVH